MNLKSSKFYYWLALLGYFGLFILLMLWHTLLNPSDKFPVALMLLLTVSPLLLPLRGLLDGNKRSCAWAAYISLIYFVHGSVETFANADQRAYWALEVLFSLLLFTGATFFVRFSGKPSVS